MKIKYQGQVESRSKDQVLKIFLCALKSKHDQRRKQTINKVQEMEISNHIKFCTHLHIITAAGPISFAAQMPIDSLSNTLNKPSLLLSGVC